MFVMRGFIDCVSLLSVTRVESTEQLIDIIREECDSVSGLTRKITAWVQVMLKLQRVVWDRVTVSQTVITAPAFAWGKSSSLGRLETNTGLSVQGMSFSG